MTTAKSRINMRVSEDNLELIREAAEPGAIPVLAALLRKTREYEQRSYDAVNS